jgi:heme-degrading monooxygenase HmoA
MFVVIVHFPQIKEGKDGEFREWFNWSNREFAKHTGFIGRRLLKPEGGGNYIAIVEYEGRESFIAVRSTPMHDEAGRRVEPLLDGNPTPVFYEVIAE